MRFQSLFCWKSVWEGPFCHIRHGQWWFQSLFCWKSVWEYSFDILVYRHNNVSILVLLEIGLGEPPVILRQEQNWSFNPCFVGNRSGRANSCFPIFQAKLVSILVLLEIGLGAGRQVRPGAKGAGFQSLFCWKSVWEAVRRCKHTVQHPVSILVLLEIGLGELLRTMPKRWQKSFNPCFVGNRSGRRIRKMISTPYMGFNPCFVGNRSGSRNRIRGRNWITNVSILVLLEIGLGEWFRLSCFSGMFVSILVLLEIGLGELRYSATSCNQLGFNPCFVGNRSGSHARFHQHLTNQKFQSLFCWKSVWEWIIYQVQWDN